MRSLPDSAANTQAAYLLL